MIFIESVSLERIVCRAHLETLFALATSCVIHAFFLFSLFKNFFWPKFFSFCWDKSDYLGSIVYLSCLVLYIRQLSYEKASFRGNTATVILRQNLRFRACPLKTGFPAFLNTLRIPIGIWLDLQMQLFFLCCEIHLSFNGRGFSTFKTIDLAL